MLLAKARASESEGTVGIMRELRDQEGTVFPKPVSLLRKQM